MPRSRGSLVCPWDGSWVTQGVMGCLETTQGDVLMFRSDGVKATEILIDYKKVARF